MAARFEGRTVLITGAARGQGRSHALAFAREGADLAVSDICADVATANYEMGTASDLEETVRLCEEAGANTVSAVVDVRDYEAVDAFAAKADQTLGGIDIVVANAGIFTFSPLASMSLAMFDDVIDINLKGVFHTIRATVPRMEGRGWGRVVIIGSTASVVGTQNVGHYTASKHGVLGLTKSLAIEQAPNGITVNCVCPNSVHTRMIDNDAVYELMSPDEPTREKALEVFKQINAIPVPWVEPEEVSSLVLFLASEQAAHMTGGDYKIDMGYTAG